MSATPTQYDALRRLLDELDAHNPLLGNDLRALLSEVDSLRAENDTMLSDLAAMFPGSRWADRHRERAARVLSSESANG